MHHEATPYQTDRLRGPVAVAEAEKRGGSVDQLIAGQHKSNPSAIWRASCTQVSFILVFLACCTASIMVPTAYPENQSISHCYYSITCR